MHTKSLCHVQVFATIWSTAYQAPLSIGFSRQEYWSGLPFLPPGDLPNPGIEPKSLTPPVLAGRFFTTSATWKVLHYIMKVKVKSLSCVRLFATSWTLAYQAPLSMGFFRQEYWSGLPCNQELAHVSGRPAILRLWPVPNGSYSPHRFIHDQNWCDKLLISLVAQTVRHLPTMQETQVRSLGWEDPLEKEMATHSSTLAWKIPWMEEHSRLQSMELQSQTRLSNFTECNWISINLAPLTKVI